MWLVFYIKLCVLVSNLGLKFKLNRPFQPSAGPLKSCQVSFGWIFRGVKGPSSAKAQPSVTPLAGGMIGKAQILSHFESHSAQET